MTRSWKKGLVASSLAWAAWVGVACGGKQSEPASDDAGAILPDGAGNEPTVDASLPDSPSSSDSPSSPDAPSSSDSSSSSDSPSSSDASDAGSCPPLYGPIRTFDQEAASLSTNPQGVANWSFACGTMECDGLLAIVDTHGADGQDLYLFDPTTGDLVETLSGNNGALFCTGSATRIDLTASPGFSGCRPAPYAPYGSGGFDFGGCGDGGPGATDASSE
jgi:hypothetical protein